MPLVTTVHPWLQPFAPHQRPLVAAWFGYAVSQGARQPAAVVDLVQRLVAHKREWSVSPTSQQLCDVTFASLAHRRADALHYAQGLLTTKETRR